MFLDSDDLPLDADAVAHRIRSLMLSNDCAAISGRLGVSERSLETSIAAEAPRPTLAIIVAIVRTHGVDPAWLITGEYNSATHRQATEGDGLAVGDLVRHLVKQVRAPSIEGLPKRSDEGSRPPPGMAPT